MKKKLLAFFLMFLYVIGTVNGIGYSCYIGEYVTAIGVLVLAVMALPTAAKCWDELNN